MKYRHKCYRLHLIFNWFYKRKIPYFYSGLAWLFSSLLLVSTVSLLFYSNVNPEVESTPAWAKALHHWLHDHSFLLFGCVLFAQGLVGAGRWCLRYFSDNWRSQKSIIKKTLNDLVEHHFDSLQGECSYRATLFKAVGPFWLVGGWLSIVARSGDAFDSTGTIFSISRNDKNCNTGLAGHCWWRAANLKKSPWICRIEDANDLHKNKVCKAELDRITVKSCFFNSVAIMRGGQVWGVLVVDSDDQDLVGSLSTKKLNAMKLAVNQYAAFITYILED